MSKTQGTLEAYESSEYGKELVLAPAKIGKTVTLLGNALGVFPWQKYGGVVSDPSCLHVITFDASALGGAMKFLTDECGAPKEIGKVKVYNLQDAARKAFASTTEYDGTFAATVYETVERVQQAANVQNKVHALIFSSLTMCAKAWLRGLSGPAFSARPGTPMKKSPMDRNKWGLFAQQMTEFQFFTQADTYHTLWETHWGEKTSETKKDASGNPISYDTIQVQGATAVQFPAQCERPYMLSRKKGPWDPKQPKSRVNMVEFDTQPNLDFGESMMAGRSVVGVLEPKENDLTYMFHKLGLRIGSWGAE